MCSNLVHPTIFFRTLHQNNPHNAIWDIIHQLRHLHTFAAPNQADPLMVRDPLPATLTHLTIPRMLEPGSTHGGQYQTVVQALSKCIHLRSLKLKMLWMHVNDMLARVSSVFVFISEFEHLDSFEVEITGYSSPVPPYALPLLCALQSLLHDNKSRLIMTHLTMTGQRVQHLCMARTSSHEFATVQRASARGIALVQPAEPEVFLSSIQSEQQVRILFAPSLEHLSLLHVTLQSAFFPALGLLTHLKTLDLRPLAPKHGETEWTYTKEDIREMWKAFGQMEKLEQIRLEILQYAALPGDEGVEAFAACKNLSSLYLTSSSLEGAFGPATAAVLAGLPRLSELTLSARALIDADGYFGVPAFKLLAGSKSLKELKVLDATMELHDAARELLPLFPHTCITMGGTVLAPPPSPAFVKPKSKSKKKCIIQ